MERKYRVDYTKFTNCLRIAIVPDDLQDERIENVRKYCLKHGFTNVMLFFNAEEYNLGHITKEEVLPWIETIKKAKRVLENAGLSVSLNPWMEIGHLDRGRKLKDGQDFTTMVDMNGVQADISVCPYDKNWREYYFDFLSWYLQEVNPDMLWIEDDFRLHNHHPLTYGGCFCKLHMQKFNAKLGTNYTREEFVERVFAKGKPTKERKAWLDINRDTYLDLSKAIGEKVQQLGLKTRVGLMSSAPQMHCMEARDWKALQKNISAGEELIDRIHLPCYDETSGKKYFYEFNTKSMVVRTFLPENTYIYPELENGSFSNFTKDARFLRFQLESSLPLLPVGMTYDIYDFVGNATVDSFCYGEAVKAVSPYLQGVVDLKLKFGDLYGVKLPVSEHACYNLSIEKDWQDLKTYDEMEIIGILSGLGVNVKPTTEKTMQGETLVLAGNSVHNFTNDELNALFKDNFVILDGKAVLALQERGLHSVIGVKTATLSPAGQDLQSYEQAEETFIVENKKRYRASCLEKANDYVKIEYESEVKVYTKTYNSKREYYGLGCVEGKNFAVIPYFLQDMPFEQYNPLRRAVWYAVLKNHQKAFVQTGVCGIHPYTYHKGDASVLAVINATVNEYKALEFESNIPFTKVYAVNRKGKLVKKSFKRNGKKVMVKMPLEYLSTATLVFE